MPCEVDERAMADLLLRLAAEWAEASGAALSWLPDTDTTARMLTEPDAGKRALWRCVVQLMEVLSASSGLDVGQLVDDLDLQPVQQRAKGPGG